MISSYFLLPPRERLYSVGLDHHQQVEAYIFIGYVYYSGLHLYRYKVIDGSLVHIHQALQYVAYTPRRFIATLFLIALLVVISNIDPQGNKRISVDIYNICIEIYHLMLLLLHFVKLEKKKFPSSTGAVKSPEREKKNKVLFFFFSRIDSAQVRLNRHAALPRDHACR